MKQREKFDETVQHNMFYGNSKYIWTLLAHSINSQITQYQCSNCKEIHLSSALRKHEEKCWNEHKTEYLTFKEIADQIENDLKNNTDNE
jgi:hypothetical protein